MELNCIIIDDEPRAIEVMKEYVDKVETLQLLKSFRNPIKALDYINENDVNVIFLDINMPNLSGIQFIKSLTNKPFIILTTAYSEYAVESYQLDVVDYLLKPIEFDRFIKSVNKVHDKFVSENRHRRVKFYSKDYSVEQDEKEYIFVKNGTKMDRIDFDDILYIEGSGNYISYQLTNKKTLVLGKMTEVLNILPKNRFIRIHKSHIVNLKKIINVENNRVHIGKDRLSISNTYRSNFYLKINSNES